VFWENHRNGGRLAPCAAALIDSPEDEEGMEMTTLTAWKFDDAEKAEHAVQLLEAHETYNMIDVLDAAWVTWPRDKKAPKTHQLHHPRATGAAGGGFFGLLFGLIFFVPILGLVVGALAGAASGALRDVGIDDEFIAQVRDKIGPGTSALFAVTDESGVDQISKVLAPLEGELVSSQLSDDQENELRNTFL
jgi:uncharacterized membrane protein